ncbi:MAG: VWA domain-containing protein [Bacteroidota bacterium]
MIQYESPDAFYLLTLLIPLGGLFVWFIFGRNQAIRRMGEESLIARLMPGMALYKHYWKFVLAAIAVILLVVALANPQIGHTYEKVQRQGVDLVIALDISRSMMAEDEKPSRLARAKQFISRLIDKLAGDRVGLVIFAGNAYLQVPMTSDYTATKTFLKTISPELAATQGTAIGEAIRLADESFDRTQKQFKAMLIISDGENHEGDAIEAAKAAANKGMIIHTMGIGSPKGAPIPQYKGKKMIGYKQDKQGGIVLSRLNEDMLRKVALTGNGQYMRLSQGNSELNAFLDEIAAMEKQEFEEHAFTDFEDQYQWFLAIALLLICLEYFLSERKSAWMSDWKIFKT